MLQPHSILTRSDATCAGHAMLDILVPTYNRLAELETLLLSLAVQQPALPPGTRIVVCDDAAPVSAEPVVRRFQPMLNIEFHRMDLNAGISAVRRRLVSCARQELILWVDDDMVLDAHCIKRHLEAFAGSTGPMLNVGTMDEVPMTAVDGILRLPLVERPAACVRHANPDVRRPFHEAGDHSRQWDACWTGHLMMRRSDGEALGWFDDRLLGWGYDDTVLMARLVHAGVRTRFDATARGCHLRRGVDAAGNVGKDRRETAWHNEAILHDWLRRLGMRSDGA